MVRLDYSMDNWKLVFPMQLLLQILLKNPTTEYKWLSHVLKKIKIKKHELHSNRNEIRVIII